MSASKPAPVYTSGFCVRDRHDHCKGAFPGVVCDCRCHRPEEDEPEPEPAAVLPLLLARHCETCACEGHG
jgi:hypothetical protein